MGLADLDQRATNPSVEAVLETLERADRDALLRALCDRRPGTKYYRWSAAELAARLAQDDIRLTEAAIKGWRGRNVPR